MEYETVLIERMDDEQGRGEVVEVHRYPIDFVGGSPMTDPNIAPVATRVITRKTIGRRVSRPVIEKSPRQDATSKEISLGQGPKTRGGTNEFISAFWVKGKPKCRKGYKYDFKRKMCRPIK